MSSKPRGKKPYIDSENYNHYDEAQQVDKSGLHTRGGHNAEPPGKNRAKPTGHELDEHYNQDELNRQRNYRAEEEKGQ